MKTQLLLPALASLLLTVVSYTESGAPDTDLSRLRTMGDGSRADSRIRLALRVVEGTRPRQERRPRAHDGGENPRGFVWRARSKPGPDTQH